MTKIAPSLTVLTGEELDQPVGDSLYLRFPTTGGYSYVLESSDDLVLWTAESTHYGDGAPKYKFIKNLPPRPSGAGATSSLPYTPRAEMACVEASIRVEFPFLGGSSLCLHSFAEAGPGAAPPWHQLVTMPVPPRASGNFAIQDYVIGNKLFKITLAASPASTIPQTNGSLPPSADLVEFVNYLRNNPATLVDLIADPGEQSQVPPIPSGSDQHKYYRLTRKEVDTNANGLPDWWEFQVGGITSAFAAAGAPGYINPNATFAGTTQTNVQMVEIQRDRDGDGVADAVDSHPDDKTRADLVLLEQNYVTFYYYSDPAFFLDPVIGLTGDPEEPDQLYGPRVHFGNIWLDYSVSSNSHPSANYRSFLPGSYSWGAGYGTSFMNLGSSQYKEWTKADNTPSVLGGYYNSKWTGYDNVTYEYQSGSGGSMELKLAQIPPPTEDITLKFLRREHKGKDNQLAPEPDRDVWMNGIGYLPLHPDPLRATSIVELKLPKGLKETPAALRLEIKPDITGYVQNERTMLSGVGLLLLDVDIRQPGTTTKSQDDDFVVVCNGSDPDLASELVINLPHLVGGSTITANVKMKGSDGGLKFEQNSVTITPGTPTVIKIWGTTPSSGENKSKVEIEFVMNGGVKVSIEEDLTIITGVEIEFAGNYYINVDTREFARRPWDGRVDTKPNTKGNLTGVTNFMDSYFLVAYPGRVPTLAEKNAFRNAVNQSDQFGYASAVSFRTGDNSAITTYKPWMDKLEVKVKKVSGYTALNAKVEIKKDKLIGVSVAFKKGSLDGLPDGSEKLLDPQLELLDFVLLEKTSNITSIAGQTDKSASVTLADITSGIAAARGKGYDEYLDHQKYIAGALHVFSDKRFKWENDSFDVTKKSKITESIAAKALSAKKQTSGKVAASWIFQDWNELKFQGNLSEAKIFTK